MNMMSQTSPTAITTKMMMMMMMLMLIMEQVMMMKVNITFTVTNDQRSIVNSINI
jgi:hypothetical protein